jgi:hypothetical protein
MTAGNLYLAGPVGTRARLRSALIAVFVLGPVMASASPVVSLGTAASFGVLAGQTVTNSGSTVIFGNVGVSPGTAITGFGSGPGLLGPGIVNGSQFTGTGPAATAKGDLTTALNNLAGLACGTSLTNTDLGSLGPLSPGVYCFTSSAQLTGTLVLNEEGLNNQEFVFQIASALNTATGSAVTEINPGPAGAADDNIFWEVGSSASLGTDTRFVGDILASTSISLGTGAVISCGAALASSGSVTLLDNAITAGTDSTCLADAAEFTPAPEPSTLMILGTALLALLSIGWSRKQLG